MLLCWNFLLDFLELYVGLLFIYLLEFSCWNSSLSFLKLLSVDGQSLDSITHEEAVVKLTQTGQVVNLTVSRNRSTRISTSESLERLKTDDSTTSADSEVYEATVKGEYIAFFAFSNFGK